MINLIVLVSSLSNANAIEWSPYSPDQIGSVTGLRRKIVSCEKDIASTG